MNAFVVISVLLGTALAQNFNIATKSIRLNSGRDCPLIGLGTGGYDGAPKGDLVKGMVRDAVGVGYRLIDTAAYYGNEKDIGEAVNELIAERVVRREELFLSTKIFYLMGQSQPISRHETAQHILKALINMNQTYLDLILFHFPSDSSEVNTEVWKGFEDALNVGWVRSIGVSNFNIEQLFKLVQKADVFPAMNQVESHPQLNQYELLDFCSQYKIHLTAWSPLGGGALIKDENIAAIGQKYDKSAAQVMLRWQLQRGVVTVPKSTKRERMIENMDIFDFHLNDEDMKALDKM